MVGGGYIPPSIEEQRARLAERRRRGKRPTGALMLLDALGWLFGLPGRVARRLRR